MKVQLLYFDNCPNWRETDHLLEEAVAIIGRGDIEVEHVLVSTPEDAERWQFHGSPTVLVDGQDPFAHLGAPVGLTCRVYHTATGLAGSPSLDQLVAALTLH